MWGRGIHVFHREVNEAWDIVAISFLGSCPSSMSLMSGSGDKAIVSLSKSYCCHYFKFLRFFGTQAYFF